MCGLIGGNNRNWEYDTAVSVLRHRGPDAQQVLNVGPLTFGFTRLAVVDRGSAADQPMLSDDGGVCLTFNGEIYGHRRLRSELQHRGYQFRTLSDTEVVLRAWLEWGPDFVDRIDGMFAIAIFDRLEDQVHLYRDRAGIKPLYYLWDGRNFAFASELKAIDRLCGDLKLRVDNTALYDFLTYGYIPAPKSLYRNVFKLPPATHMVFDVGKQSIIRTRRYWELPTEQRATANIEEVAEELTHHMQQSVTEQLVADVPVGCFLSGGIDSSIVVATANDCIDQLQTFAVGFDMAEHSETAFAREVAAQFETDHREITFHRTDMEDQLSQLINLYDEPFADTSAFPTVAVSEFARQSVTVALSGDGGDELFGGYKWYRRYANLRRLGATQLPGPSGWFDRAKHRLPTGGWLRKIVGAAAFATADELSLYVSLMGGMTKSRKSVYADLLEIDADYDDCWHFRQHWRRDLPLLTRLQYLDFHTYLPDDILTKVDRASMSHSLEVRVPFLSRQLIEFAFSLPEDIRFHGNRLKGLLKHAYQQILPSVILSRPKKGFSMPPSHVSSFGGHLREIILARNHNVPLMRIAYLSDSTIPSHKANSIQVMQMCNAFASAGHDVTLFARPGTDAGDDYAYYGVERAFEIVKTPAPGTRRLREWRYAWATRNDLQRRKPFDLIYGRHLPSLAVATRHQTPFIYESHQPASPLGQAIEHLLFRRTNLEKVVFISEALREAYLSACPRLSIHHTQVCHDGAADTPAYTLPTLPVRQNGRLRVGYIGSLYRGRGIGLINTVARRLNDFEFHICGGSPEAIGTCRRLAPDCVNIQFHGFVSPSMTRSWQQSMDILVAPYQTTVSTVQWMSPLKIFEYMAAGRPIVASDIPVLREVLADGRNALLVPPDIADCWEAALRRLSEQHHRDKLARHAFDDFRAGYTWELRAQNVLQGISWGDSAAAA